MEADRIIASIAAGQHAAAGRRQLLDAGVPAHVIGHRVRGGLLLPMHAGVYRVPGSPVTWHQRIMAATLAAGAGAVASHRAAGYLHGLEGIEPMAEVTVDPSRTPHPRGVVVHRLKVARTDVYRHHAGRIAWSHDHARLALLISMGLEDHSRNVAGPGRVAAGADPKRKNGPGPPN
jgi:hypothetical protein